VAVGKVLASRFDKLSVTPFFVSLTPTCVSLSLSKAAPRRGRVQRETIMRAVILASGIMAFAGAASAQEQQSGFDRPYWLDRSVIEAVGRAELEVMPDRATFSITFEQTEREAGEASAQAADRARLAVAAMRQRGGQAVEIRSSVTMQANYEEYRNREGVVEQREGAENIRSYTARVQLDVEVTDIARAPGVRAAALAVGPEQSQPLQFSLRMTAEHQRRVFTAAAADAAARGRAAAEATGARLGPLLVLQEGQGPCLGEWYGSRPGTYAPAPPPPPPPPSYAGDEDVVVTGSRNVGGRAQQLRVTQEQIDRLDLPADIAPMRLHSSVCAVYAAGAAG
jgi:uncharacterized protein YggE